MSRSPAWTGQVARLAAWATDAGLPVAAVEAGAGSRLRAKMRGLVPGRAVNVVVARAPGPVRAENTELAEAALSARHRRLVVPGNSEVTGDRVGGLVGVLASFCAGL